MKMFLTFTFAQRREVYGLAEGLRGSIMSALQPRVVCAHGTGTEMPAEPERAEEQMSIVPLLAVVPGRE